jgi:hypothetical protein
MPVERDLVVLVITFIQEGGVEVEWVDANEHDELGGTVWHSRITKEGQQSDAQVGYYADELRQDAEELLHAWLKTRRKSAAE